jgi:hypothetical protein
VPAGFDVNSRTCEWHEAWNDGLQEVVVSFDPQIIRDSFALVVEREPELARRFYEIFFERYPKPNDQEFRKDGLSVFSERPAYMRHFPRVPRSNRRRMA